MSDLRDRIAAIVGTHEHWQRPNLRWECACGASFELKVQIDAHVADAVIRELQQPQPGLQPDGSFIDPAGIAWRHNGTEWTDDPTYRP